MSSESFLINLALVLGVAAVAAALSRSVRQPPMLGYLLAGVLVGPHTAFPLFADVPTVQSLSELGVILLMFSIGLQVSGRKLASLAPVAGPAAAVEMSVTGLLGFAAARMLGFDPLASIFAGSMLMVSSSMVVMRTFADLRVTAPYTNVVLGIMVFEDLASIVLITVLTAVATGSGVSVGDLFETLGGLATFLLGVAVIGVLLVPRSIRAVTRLRSDETTLVYSVGLCFAMAVLAKEAGFSVALGALLAGVLVSESGVGERIGRLITSLQDLFAAIFFVSVGMLIEPRRLAENPGTIAIFTAVLLVAKLTSVTMGCILVGQDIRRSVRASMSLAHCGEFAFIIIGIGLVHGVVPSELMAVAVGATAITAFTTPYLVRASNRVAVRIDQRVPRRLATLITLYGSWFDQLRAGRSKVGASTRRRIFRRLVVDVACLIGLTVLLGTVQEQALEWMRGTFAISRRQAWLGFYSAALLLSLPFWIGLLRNALKLGRILAETVLPPSNADTLDAGRAPRLALAALLQAAIVAMVSLPLALAMQPLLPVWVVLPAIVLVVAALAYSVWRQSGDLHGHVNAGAEVVLEALRRQLPETPDDTLERLEEVERLFPGLGPLIPVRLSEDTWATGRTLKQIELHAWTGATVVALQRGQDGIASPGYDVRLQPGDVLILVGSHTATDAATRRLAEGPQAEPMPPEEALDSGDT